MAVIIFDFDGTIADSFDYVADFLAEGAGAAPLSARQRKDLQGISMAAMARHLGYSWWKLPFMFVIIRRKMSGIIRKLQPFEGMAVVIRQFHGEGHQLFIVSSNSDRNIRGFLRHHELQGYFSGITGSIGMFSKAGALRRLLKKHRLRPDEAVYIGDELRDVQAAQSIDLPVIAVSWGFARTADLAAAKPTAVAKTPAELASIIKKL